MKAVREAADSLPFKGRWRAAPEGSTRAPPFRPVPAASR